MSRLALVGSLTKPSLGNLALALRSGFGISTFVETGTYKGETTAWAAERFEQVITVELNDEYREHAMTAMSDVSNVRFVAGDSATALPAIVTELAEPALFWLDAHSGGGYFGVGDACPILDELAAINASPHEHFILIDDARGFVAPPPPPFDWTKWPDLRTVLDAVTGAHPHHVVIVEDVLVCVPERARDTLREAVFAARPKI